MGTRTARSGGSKPPIKPIASAHFSPFQSKYGLGSGHVEMGG
jgi:hypothetical protein